MLWWKASARLEFGALASDMDETHLVWMVESARRIGNNDRVQRPATLPISRLRGGLSVHA